MSLNEIIYFIKTFNERSSKFSLLIYTPSVIIGQDPSPEQLLNFYRRLYLHNKKVYTCILNLIYKFEKEENLCDVIFEAKFCIMKIFELEEHLNTRMFFLEKTNTIKFPI